MGTEKRLIVISCHRFVVGPVVIDHVLLVKCTSHRLSVAQFAQPNLEIGQNSNITSLNMCETFSEMTDFEMPSWGKRKPEEASQGQGRRAVRQAVAEGRNDRDVTRRLVDVLATLSLVNAAELRELTATVFKTYLVPGSERVAEAMAEAGRLYHESAGAIKSKPEAERADAQEQLGPPYVHVWVRFLRQSGDNEGAGTRTRCGVEVVLEEQRGEERAGAAGGARTALSSEAVQENRGQGRLDAHRVLPGPGHSPLEGALEAALQLQKGVRKHGLAPRGPLEREASRVLTQMRGK